MSDSWISTTLRDEADLLSAQIGKILKQAIDGLDHRIALPPGSEAALLELDEPLPENGSGMQAAMNRLLDLNARAGANTGGPKCFHFVIGGSTPPTFGPASLSPGPWCHHLS